MSIQEKPSPLASKAIDLSHHLSDLSKRRELSPLKGLQKYAGRPGTISLAGGMYSLSLCSLTRIDGVVYMARNAGSHVLSLCLPYCGGPRSRRVPLHQALGVVSFQLVLEHVWCIHGENGALYHSQVWCAPGRRGPSHRAAVL